MIISNNNTEGGNMLGLCMIVKDSSDTIERAIKSVKAYCKQLLVVDTGSQDNTPQIATRLGAEVHFRLWRDDFAYARNYALNFMRTQWIIVLDSDEELDANSFEKNRDLLRNDEIGGINLIIRNFLGDSNQSAITEHRYTRIFRNYKGFKFSGRIHEQIRESIENSEYKIFESDITIKHYGYSEKTIERAQRNIDILEREIIEKPDDFWYKYHLAESQFAGKQFDEARKNFFEALNSTQLQKNYEELVKIRLAQIALSQNDFDEVAKFLNFVSNDSDIEGFRLFIKAGLFIQQHKFKEAFELYEMQIIRNSNYIDKGQLEFILSKRDIFRSFY